MLSNATTRSYARGNRWSLTRLCGAVLLAIGGTCDGGGLITEAVGPPIAIENLTDPTGPTIGEAVGPPIAIENLTDPTGPTIGEAVGPTVTLENLGSPHSLPRLHRRCD